MSEGIANVGDSEIEITPEMIEAGVEELYGHPIAAHEPSTEEVCEAVIETYRAMALLRPKSLNEV